MRERESFTRKEVQIAIAKIESTLHAIQTWVALPESDEESEPWFRHYKSADIPTWTENGVKITLIAGETKDKLSPVETLSPTIYLDLVFTSRGKFMLLAEYSERAIYSVTPGIIIDGKELEQHRMAILAPKSEVEITAKTDARCIVIGGEPVGERHKWWNFVSSRRERIEQAKQDWQLGKFPQVPQETEFIPLPEEETARPQPLS